MIRAVENPSDAPDTDAALLADVARGDRKAFERLHRRFYGAVMGFALRTGLAADLADEAASDTMLAVWKAAARFEGRSKVSTWIFGIAYRQTMRRHRRRMTDKMAVPLDAVPDRPDLSAAPARLDDRASIARALSKLDPELRALVEMTYVWGLSCREAAEIVDCAVGTVKSRMSLARHQLRAVLGGSAHD
ncbi:MAG: sigma-70 family RNA polymerase sigma factor [Pseudomonadota bacterium]